MRRFLFGFAFAAALLALCAVPAPAQNQGATTGNLAGTVLDASKASVPDATVTITGPLGSQSMSSRADGSFEFRNLTPGSYSVKVEKQGFSTFTVPAVDVLINNTATIQAILQTGAISTTLEVTSTAVTVDPTQSSVNDNLTDTFYNSIPIQRNVSAIMYLAPGVVTGLGTSMPLMGSLHPVEGSDASFANPSIDGASGLENLYVADGVILNDPSYGGLGGFSTVYGAIGVGITPAFVKEEEVKTAGFEPQYGHSTGGVVQIVTKSGSTQFHGTIGGYFHSPGMQSGFANKDDFDPVNLIGRQLPDADYEGDFELGGYIPGLRNHLFFFGAFDPTFFNDYEAPALGSGLYGLEPTLNRRTNTYSYAGKLTYKITDSTTVESSAFGDPAHTNHGPFSTLNIDNLSGDSKWDYGTRNWDTRIYTSITPSWTADFAFTYGWNHFTETPADTTIYPILDQTQTAGLAGQRGQFDAQGLGTGIIVNYQSHSETLSFDTTKIFTFAGTHSLSVGYFWQYPTYDNVTSYSTPKYAIPGTNATGGAPGTASAAGRMSDADLELEVAPGYNAATGALNPGSTPCSLCPLMDVPGYAGGVPVVLYQVRGRFDGGISHSTGKYHDAYVNDSWQMSQHVTLNLGLRWEQQRLVGSTASAFFNDQWSPRIGFIVSPNPESKIYADFDRLAFVLPLDMAVRELGGEDDNLNEYWAPLASSTALGSDGVTHPLITPGDLDKYGTATFVPDAAHLLNNAAGGIPTSASIEIQSGGEPFVPGTRFEYNDEWVVGAEHKFHGGFFASARYINRRLPRIIEDMVGESVEQLEAVAANGGSYSYVIGNPSANFTHFVTPNEQTWQPSSTAISDYNALAGTMAGAATVCNANGCGPANYMALDPPAGCFSGGTLTPYVSGPMYSSLAAATGGPSVGTACFPTVGTDPSTGAALYGGEYYPGSCPTSGGRSLCKPDLYPSAVRNYQAVEFEVNKTFSNNWMLRSNFRIASLNGNYEGAFRNDNNQSDPGISSLYDLTDGDLGLLNYQLGIGPLNTDRRYVLNVEPVYTIANGFAKNLEMGAALNILSGIPLTTLYAQQIYGDPGEVPVNGRGDLGRSPVIGTIDAHLAYPWKFSESRQLKFEFDAFNLDNTKRSVLTTQQADLAFGVLNQDFFDHVPLTFNPPFSARFSVLFTF